MNGQLSSSFFALARAGTLSNRVTHAENKRTAKLARAAKHEGIRAAGVDAPADTSRPHGTAMTALFDVETPKDKTRHGQTVLHRKIERGKQSKARRQERKMCRSCGREFPSRRKWAKHKCALAHGSDRSVTDGKVAEQHSPANSAPLTVPLERVSTPDRVVAAPSTPPVSTLPQASQPSLPPRPEM